MVDQIWDASGSAGGALAHVVEGFGTPVLGRPDMLEGLLNDDVPQLPREVAMLTAAARFGVADRLAERVQQGVAADAAVTMVATEMTSRTAVDAAGAQWAARVFAQVIGYQVTSPQSAPPRQDGRPDAVTVEPAPSPIPPEPAPPVSVPPVPPTRPQESVAPPTRRLDAGPAVDGPTVPPDEQKTIGPDWRQVPQPQPLPVPVPVAPAPGAANLAVAAAAATSLGVLAQFLLAALPETHAGKAVFWVSTLVLVAGGALAAILVLRDRRSAVGPAAVLGFAVPLISWAIYETAAATTFTGISSVREHLLVAGGVISLIAALAAGGIAMAALARQRQLARRASDGLTLGLVAVGVAFPLTNIVAQIKFHGTNYDYVLGPGVTGWHIVWGLLFLVLFALPPVLSWFLAPHSSSQLGLWSTWLVLVLSWQISDSPVSGAEAAFGLALSWIAWVLALAGTLALAQRWSAAQRARVPEPTVLAGSPWPPNQA